MKDLFRSHTEIVDRIKSVKEKDWLGIQVNDLLEYLPFSEAKQFLTETATAEDWDIYPKESNYSSIVQKIHDYMPFAWNKANDCKGLSAGRSLDHMKSWLWLIRRDLAVIQLEGGHSMYGKPHLRAICEDFGWDWKKWDDGYWSNSERDYRNDVIDEKFQPPETVEALR